MSPNFPVDTIRIRPADISFITKRFTTKPLIF